MSSALIVLLPPSEAKAFGGERGRIDGGFDSALRRRPRREIVKALEDLVRRAPQATLERTLNVRGPLLKRAVLAAKQVGAHRAPLLPAWQRYSGVVWSHLDPSTLVSEELSRIIVPSGLYGMTTGEDLVADYRLRMNVRLPDVGNVASFWRPRLVPVLSSGLTGATFVNLLPKEHEAAFDLNALAEIGEVVTVSFSHRGGVAAAGHDAKAVKGVLARRLLREGTGVLESFAWEQWRVSPSGDGVTVVGL